MTRARDVANIDGLLTAKGDIYAASAAATPVNVPVGSNNQTILADSAQTAGIKWGASPQSLMTATGDTLYASSANTPARLAVGNTGDVLTVAGGVPTWAAPANTQAFTLINSGGTSLSTGTTTVSGISGKNQLHIWVTGYSANNGSNANVTFRINTDSGNNYYWISTLPDMYTPTSGINLKELAAAATTGELHLFISGANSTGIKPFQWISRESNGGSAAMGMGYYGGTSTISSVSIITSTGSWDAGTIRVYGA